MKKYIEYLKGRQEVCLPEMQAELDISYSEFRQDLAELRAWGYISESTESSTVTVNTALVLSKERFLAEDELAALAGGFSEDAVELFVYLGGVYDLPDSFEPDLFKRAHEMMSFEGRRGLKELINKGIMHKYEGCYYSSISSRSYSQLRSMLIFEAEEEVMYIGHPLVLSVIKGRRSEETAQALLELPVMPEKAIRYYNEALEEYKRTGKKPLERVPKPDRSMRLESAIIRAFLVNCECVKQHEYIDQANKAFKVIKKHVLPTAPLYRGTNGLLRYLKSNTIMRIHHDAYFLKRAALEAKKAEDGEE